MDPSVTDPDKYKVIFENDKVRVLDYRDSPGDRTNQHWHPSFVLYALSPFKRRIHFADGNHVDRQFNEGDVIWSDEQIHIGENTGNTPTHALIVEFKVIA